MQTKFNVPTINCEHCVNAIKSELNDLNGVKSVSGDPATKTITVDFDSPASVESIKSMLIEINYPPTE